MKKKSAVLFLFLLSLNLNAQTLVNSYSSTPTSPGFDDTDEELASGSLWGLIKIKNGSESCTSYSSQYYSYYKTKNTYVDSYVTKDQTCDDVSYDDPYGYFSWIEFGTEQLASFGLETIYCSPLKSCEATKKMVSYTLNNDSISPSVGEDGTEASNGYLFASYVNSLSGYSINGKGGSTGSIDIALPTVSSNYCYKNTDASNSTNVDACKVPIIDIDQVFWNAFSFSSNSLYSSSPTSKKKIMAYDGLDESVVFLLENAYKK